jgi:hypothetical protein
MAPCTQRSKLNPVESIQVSSGEERGILAQGEVRGTLVQGEVRSVMAQGEVMGNVGRNVGMRRLSPLPTSATPAKKAKTSGQ